jgi:gamma-tubulin complex component 3
MFRMCLIARLVDGALPLQGGALISRAYGFALNGDPASVALVKRMMVSICHPMYAVLHRWIVHGELIDTHKEFFIGINQEVSINGGNLWHDLYFIRVSMLPRFLSLELAQKILVIGKSINFLRACDHTGAWDKEAWKGSKKSKQVSMKPAPAPSSDSSGSSPDESLLELDASLKAIKFGDEARLEEIVSRIAVQTDAKLLRVMMERAHLSEHLLALKKFMLLGQVSHSC